jgi:hypothetical protein
MRHLAQARNPSRLWIPAHELRSCLGMTITIWFCLKPAPITYRKISNLSSPFFKYILIYRIPKSLLYLSPSCPTEGRLEIVTDAGQDAVDASGALDEGALLRTVKTCGPDASRLASSRWSYLLVTVSNKP